MHFSTWILQSLSNCIFNLVYLNIKSKPSTSRVAFPTGWRSWLRWSLSAKPWTVAATCAAPGNGAAVQGGTGDHRSSVFAENTSLGGSVVGHFICRQGCVVLIGWAVGLVGIEEVEEWKVLVQASLHPTSVCQVASSLNHHVLQWWPICQYNRAFTRPVIRSIQTTSRLPRPFMCQVLHISPWSQHIREHDYASCWRIPWPVAWWLVGVPDAATWCQRCRPWMAMIGGGKIRCTD